MIRELHHPKSWSRDWADPGERLVTTITLKAYNISECCRAITKILIANNGIAAVKCIRSIRRWSYENFGSERAIRVRFFSVFLRKNKIPYFLPLLVFTHTYLYLILQFVVMVTPEDFKANAEYFKIADYVRRVPGGSNNNNYANVELIVDLAIRDSVHAVWAGQLRFVELMDLIISIEVGGTRQRILNYRSCSSRRVYRYCFKKWK